ncbi:hypothetical protein A4H34_02335 [Peptidiphaga gingivicola]|uniref:Uncharacterized protein n=1 Tax=Peptidiphaga gingivicola TaxID=2741497 RepID=A0A179B2X3_9ACTO|nr:hypothetical protein A4H34_02335 [Peptidiphaga gingivicola]
MFRAARRAAETILPCASDTNSVPQEPRRSLFAKTDASAAVADSVPQRHAAPTKAFSPSPKDGGPSRQTIQRGEAVRRSEA